jgi:hypothetical protein
MGTSGRSFRGDFSKNHRKAVRFLYEKGLAADAINMHLAEVVGLLVITPSTVDALSSRQIG